MVASWSIREDAVQTLRSAQDLYDRGRFLAAYELGRRAFGPLRAWNGPDARVLAGRLAPQLGAPRLGVAIHFWNHRRNPGHEEAAYFHLSSRARWEGAWSALRRARAAREKLVSRELQAHVLASEARALAVFRDFTNARGCLEQAEALSPNDPWLHVVKAGVATAEDRIEEALGLLEEALVLRPNYLPALHELAASLVELDRVEEAIERLTRARGHVESGWLERQLAMLLGEVGRHREALDAVARAEAAFVLAEPELEKSLAAARADLAHRLGDLAEARAAAAKADTPFYRRFHEKLGAEPVPGERRALEVPWVRQKHMTCAPATIASLAHHFREPVDHDALTHEICYGGTEDHGERRWAEARGFCVRELTVTLEVTEALIQRGVPFAVTTIEATSGHLQVVFGYDSTRETLLIRDPSRRLEVEYDARAFLERYRASGPRGLVLLPSSEAGRLVGLELPDAERYDHLHALTCALEAFDPESARRALAALHALGPDHRLALMGTARLARSEHDRSAWVDALSRLHEQHPQDPRVLLELCAALVDLRPWAEADARLAEAAERVGADSAVLRAYAEGIARDPRERPLARQLLRRALRRAPTDAANAYALAAISWDERRFDDGLELFRFASCLSETHEPYALSFFRASRAQGEAEVGLAFLRDRAAALAKSSLPVQTLFEAYRQLDRHEEGFEALEAALRRHDDDGPLALFAAEVCAAHGRGARALELLGRAEKRTSELARLRSAARVRARLGDGARAREHWRRVVELDPLDLAAEEQLSFELAASAGPAAALARLADKCARYPAHFDLAVLRLRVAELEGRDAYGVALEHLKAIAPRDSWVRREEAIHLANSRRYAESLELLREVCTLDPGSGPTWGLQGHVLVRMGDRAAARAALLRAVELEPDHELSLQALMDTCEDVSERRQVLGFVRERLARATRVGSGVVVFARSARGFLPEHELLEFLERLHAERPEVPATAMALAEELVSQAEIPRALALIQAATDRFRGRSDLWLKRADIAALAADEDDRLYALERAHEFDPDSIEACIALAEELLQRQAYARAAQVAEAGLLQAPMSPALHLALAEARGLGGDREAAYAEVERLLERTPDFEAGWQRLESWGAPLGRSDAPLEAARALTRRRPDEPRAWYTLALRLERAPDLTEFEAAIARALELNPEMVEVRDLRARVLAGRARWSEALAACAEGGASGSAPVILRARRAWILAQQGRTLDAIAELEAVLEASPDLVRGWLWISDLYAMTEDVPGQLRAARALTRLMPESPVSHGYAAEAFIAGGQRAEAKAHLWRALALDRGYLFGATTVFDLHLQDGELEEAARALTRLSAAEASEVQTRLRELALRAAQKDRPGAEAAHGHLLRTPGVEPWATARADEILLEAGWSDALERSYASALQDAQASGAAFGSWVERAVKSGPEAALRAACRSPLAEQGGAHAVSVLIQRLAQTLPVWRLLLLFLRFRKVFAGHTPTWGAVGYAMTVRKAPRWACAWLADYARRKGVEPWHLFNLAYGYRVTGRHELAFLVHEAALEATPDHTVDDHRAWIALYAALGRNERRALEMLRAISGVSFAVNSQLPVRLAEIVLAARALADRREYAAVAPLHLALTRVIERAASTRLTPGEVNTIQLVVRRIAETRPWLQGLWIRLAWGVTS